MLPHIYIRVSVNYPWIVFSCLVNFHWCKSWFHLNFLPIIGSVTCFFFISALKYHDWLTEIDEKLSYNLKYIWMKNCVWSLLRSHYILLLECLYPFRCFHSILNANKELKHYFLEIKKDNKLDLYLETLWILFWKFLISIIFTNEWY